MKAPIVLITLIIALGFISGEHAKGTTITSKTGNKIATVKRLQGAQTNTSLGKEKNQASELSLLKDPTKYPVASQKLLSEFIPSNKVFKECGDCAGQQDPKKCGMEKIRSFQELIEKKGYRIDVHDPDLENFWVTQYVNNCLFAATGDDPGLFHTNGKDFKAPNPAAARRMKEQAPLRPQQGVNPAQKRGMQDIPGVTEHPSQPFANPTTVPGSSAGGKNNKAERKIPESFR
jgi:hypothetical protein